MHRIVNLSFESSILLRTLMRIQINAVLDGYSTESFKRVLNNATPDFCRFHWCGSLFDGTPYAFLYTQLVLTKYQRSTHQVPTLSTHQVKHTQKYISTHTKYLRSTHQLPTKYSPSTTKYHQVLNKYKQYQSSTTKYSPSTHTSTQVYLATAY